MDRKFVEELLAKNARRRAAVQIDLPKLGTTVSLLTSLNNDEQLRVFQAGGGDEDAGARQLVGMLRFLLVDDDGTPVLRSFAEASQFVAALDVEDLTVLFDKLGEIAGEIEAAAAAGGQVEAGKAS